MPRPALIVLALVVTPAGVWGQTDLTPGFDPGPAPEMDSLAFLRGPWTVTPEFGNPADPTAKWYATTTVETRFVPELGGTFLRSDLAVTWPDGQVWKTISIWSYDRFRREYRVAILDDQWGLLDVYEGGYVEGRLQVDNGRAQTWGPASNGPPAMARVVLRDIGTGGFTLEWEGSTDGKVWAAAGLRWVYRRAP